MEIDVSVEDYGEPVGYPDVEWDLEPDIEPTVPTGTGTTGRESKPYDREGDKANWEVEDVLERAARERGLIQ